MKEVQGSYINSKKNTAFTLDLNQKAYFAMSQLT